MLIYKTSDNSAIISGDRSLSYRDLEEAVTSTTQFMMTWGLYEKQRVAICNTNSIEYVIALLALWRIGSIPVLLSTRLPEEAISKQLNPILCHVLVTSDERLLDSPYIYVQKLHLTKLTKQKLLKHEEYVQSEYDVPGEQEASIIFTSGSAGWPKAVMHTMGNHLASARGANTNIPLGPSDRWLLSLPLYHVGGLSILFRCFQAGASIVIPQTSDLITSIQENGVTHLSVVPTQLVRLLEHPEGTEVLKKLKAILLGGASISEELLAECAKLKLPVYTTYGLTEMASQVATTDQSTKETAHPTAKVLPERELQVHEGEIWVKGAMLFKGYVRGSSVRHTLRRGGWFPTGDMGSLSEDGSLTVSGRKDQMFISGGENIHPEEIEKALWRLPEVMNAIVVPIEDDEFGQRPVAYIRLREETELDPRTLSDQLSKYLPKFKIPDYFLPWPEHLITGIKPNRKEFAKLAQDQLSSLA